MMPAFGFPVALGYGVRIGGQYRAMLDARNFDFHGATVADVPSLVVNQRLRTWMNLHDVADQTHGAYVQLEIGHTLFGSGGEFPKADPVELRRGYLWARPNDALLVKVGVQGFHDRFGERPGFRVEDDDLFAVDAYDSFQAPLANSIWDFNVGGVSAEGALSHGLHYRAGVFVLEQNGISPLDDGGAVLGSGDLDVEVGPALVGVSAYVVRDNGDYSYGTFAGPAAAYDSSLDAWLGVRAHLDLGMFKPSAFVIYNGGGTTKPDFTHNGFAAKLGTDVKTDVGTFHFFLHGSTGGAGSEFRTIAQSVRDDRGAQGYWSLLGASSPRGPSDLFDLGVSLQNQGRGLASAQAGYDGDLGKLVSIYAATGVVTSSTALGNAMGEILAEGTVHLFPSMNLSVGLDVLGSNDFFAVGGADANGAFYEAYSRFQLEI